MIIQMNTALNIQIKSVLTRINDQQRKWNQMNDFIRTLKINKWQSLDRNNEIDCLDLKIRFINYLTSIKQFNSTQYYMYQLRLGSLTNIFKKLRQQRVNYLEIKLKVVLAQLQNLSKEIKYETYVFPIQMQRIQRMLRKLFNQNQQQQLKYMQRYIYGQSQVQSKNQEITVTKMNVEVSDQNPAYKIG
ncbi:Hypothetical_protein [Hexamita inflata]|uniref:Hypothetical_protein n=1 Tax=Hexamita inflata TaxID=28002 RepID=A0AA86NJQ6_9EUKA|nr:Hypothetical protein HINF_LOCUS8248 [Hexamita inflata]